MITNKYKFIISFLIITALIATALYLWLPAIVITESNISNNVILVDGKVTKKVFWTKPGKHAIRSEAESAEPVSIQIQAKRLWVNIVKIEHKNKTTIQATNAAGLEIISKNQGLAGGAGGDFSYLSIPDKAILKFSSNEVSKLIDLQFLNQEDYYRDRWSANQKILVLFTHKNEALIARSINLETKTISILDDATVDAALEENDIILLKSRDSKTEVFKNDKLIFSINDNLHNISAGKNNYMIYNSILNDNQKAYICSESGQCNSTNIKDMLADAHYVNGSYIYTSIGKNTALYELTERGTKVIEKSISPVLYKSNDHIYYVTKYDTCSLYSSNIKSRQLLYQSDEICELNGFSVNGDKIFIDRGMGTEVLETIK